MKHKAAGYIESTVRAYISTFFFGSGDSHSRECLPSKLLYSFCALQGPSPQKGTAHTQDGLPHHHLDNPFTDICLQTFVCLVLLNPQQVGNQDGFFTRM